DIVRRFTAMTSDYPGERAPVSLNDVLRDVVDLFDYALKRGRVNLVLELAGELPTVWGDARRLHELSAHLIANALQAMLFRPARCGSARGPLRPTRGSTWPSESPERGRACPATAARISSTPSTRPSPLG